MCGRAAQTRRAVRRAEDELLGHGPPAANNNTSTRASRGGSISSSSRQQQQESSYEWQDNYNMSPGMSCTIFYRDDDNTVKVDRKVWGLVPSGGTRNKPLPTGMTLHFEKLMFNARSDTLLEKRSFAPLFARGRTCVVAVDGFFEWKAQLKGQKKQPYFVYRKSNHEDPLLFAGLWTSVSTGRADDEKLDTFTIITTEACSSLEWLHSRMPLTIYDTELARQWLEKPSRTVFKQMDEAVTPPGYFQWHAVTTEMNTTKYRSQDAVKPVPTTPSVKSFFSVVKKGEASEKARSVGEAKPSPTVLKRSPADSAASSPPSKKQKTTKPAKKGPIETFFSPNAAKK